MTKVEEENQEILNNRPKEDTLPTLGPKAMDRRTRIINKGTIILKWDIKEAASIQCAAKVNLEAQTQAGTTEINIQILKTGMILVITLNPTCKLEANTMEEISANLNTLQTNLATKTTPNQNRGVPKTKDTRHIKGKGILSNHHKIQQGRVDSTNPLKKVGKIPT